VCKSQPHIQRDIQAGLRDPACVFVCVCVLVVVDDGLDELEVDVAELVEPEVVDDLFVCVCFCVCVCVCVCV
jgi:hypothetical protein